MTLDVPPSLRAWFVAHFAVDTVVAVPLLLFPARILERLGWAHVDPVATRLVAAALLGIGGASFLCRNQSAEVYRAMLSLKVIWSLAAVFALLAGIGEGAPSAAWAFLSLFIAFSGVWIHYAIRFRQLSRAAEDTPDDPPKDAPEDGPDPADPDPET